MNIVCRVSVLTGIGLLPIVSLSTNTAEKKPNVLFILADDFGYYDMSCMGSKFYETPNIDQIASQGMVFTNGYAACQVCSPSRASILSGKFPARHGITDWIGAASGEKWRDEKRFSQLLPPKYVHSLPAEYVTLPEALQQAGYHTFFAGKWHLGDTGSLPEDHGFDINIGGWDAGSPKGGYFSPYQNPKLQDGKHGENLSMRLARETVKFLKENNPKQTGKPVLAYLSFYAVHGPIETTQEKWSKYRQKAENAGIATAGFKMGHFLPIRQVQDNPVYAGLVEQMDDAVGLVMTSLKELGINENTIVIFTSDNGGVAAGDAFATSNLPLRAGKGYQFEGGIREPYFIKVPGLTKEGQKCDTPVSGTDFYPTILELAGLKQRPQEHSDGVSLVPLLKGKQLPERALIWHYPHYGNQGGEPSSIIRKGDWKLIHYYEDGRDELYNLKTDLSETSDVSGNNRKLASQLHKELFDYLAAVDARFPQKDPAYSAEAERNYLDGIVKNRLPQLEQQRLDFLSKDFNPKNNWWGSKVTKD